MKVYGPQAGIYYFLNDHLGTPHMLVNGDGRIVWQAAYLPFGETVLIKEEIQNPFRFPGQYFDEETGLHYNYHRYYDPRTGRYLRPDPIGLIGGINLYIYSENNSVIMFDFFGLCVQGVFYDKNNIPIGELGLIPDFKTPDVIYGLDTPIGGISTLLPFGSGGLSITNYQSPSYNIPLGPGVNSKFYISIKEGVISEGPTISTPILEGRFTLDTTLRLNAKLGGAKVNFPVGYGANAYIGLEW